MCRRASVQRCYQSIVLGQPRAVNIEIQMEIFGFNLGRQAGLEESSKHVETLIEFPPSLLLVRTFFCPISTAVRVRKSSLLRYLSTLTSSFISRKEAQLRRAQSRIHYQD